MSKHKIVILGGTGFVGRCLTARLCALGHEVWMITRRRERHRDLLVLPTVQVIDTWSVSSPCSRRKALNALWQGP